MRGSVAVLVGLAALLSAAADAQDEPDLSFLEYLGTWQEDDEEWLVVSDWEPSPDSSDRDPGNAEPGPPDEPETEVEDAND
jgi:hypothetical protein